MGFLAFFKSLPGILGVAGVAVAGIWIGILKHQVNNLESDLLHCQERRAVIEFNRDILAAQLDAAIARAEQQAEKLRQSREDQETLTAEAEATRKRLQEELAATLATIERTHVPETVDGRLAQCERARLQLVQ